MDGEDHESTVIRPLGGPAAPILKDPGGLVEETIPSGQLGAARAGTRAESAEPRTRSAHVESTGQQAARADVPRYRFSVNGGAPLSTDAPTFIGRRPTAPRMPGSVTPRLVRVDSVSHEVSGTHLQVRQEGASVVVSDVRSTNGTIVTMPGADPVRMLPGESIVAVPGSLVDIGDGNIVEILGIERRFPDLSGR